MFRMRTVKRYAPIILLITLLNYYIIWNWTGFDASTNADSTVHVGVVVRHHSECRTVPLLIKSVLVHRNGPIHFHFLLDATSWGVLREVFQTWNLTSTVANFHLLEDHPNKTRLSTGDLKLQLVRHLPSGAQKVILMGPRVIILADVGLLWLESIESNKALIMSDFQNKINTLEKSQILLLKTESIPGPYVTQSKRMTMYLPHSKTHAHCLYTIGNHTSCKDSEMLHVLCEQGKRPSKHTIESMISFDGYQIQEQTMNEKRNGTDPWLWNWICRDFYLQRYRVHPFFIGQVHHSLDTYDVTMVVQLSWDRLNRLEMMLGMWSGPMSVSLYIEDAEIPEIIQSIPLLQRENVAIHVVYKNHCSKYPINFLRNLAWKYANTPYVFLNDIDFIPNPDVYMKLRHALQRHPLGTGTFVVPAFRTNFEDLEFPKSKELLEQLVLQGKITPFREGEYDRLHGPTDYKQWFRSSEPYNIEWKYDYEPYVVVSYHASRYDERFVGYGRNKISHIEELHAQDYTFTVLPDVYTIHYPHALTADRIAFMRLLTAVTASRYFICIALLDMAFEEDLEHKYGYVRVDPWH